MGPHGSGRAPRVSENSFASVRRRLQESRKSIPTGSFVVETIVTAQAIKETQSSTIRKLEGEIRNILGATAWRGAETGVAVREKTLQGKDTRLVPDDWRCRCRCVA